ncbi:MAG: hypothetical protein B6D44_14820 [Ignavibacteriales bacterium UTCHB2]|nr:MAG: hypothetical protein BWY38_00064 [Ignavibacteria bacterium ADurb.Bin266]OQY70724.1 MAG: hypothetical protein B6D44_14820 [Ignavibacteriales bacterium UTCHB2]HQI42104.1 hypothetical protein [Ignavibacteriaceae bacterium]
MKTALILFFITFFSVQLTAQWDKYPRPDEGFINGGLGLTWIDGKPHYRIAFRPEISFSDFGIGLDLNLDFDSEGKLRKENFNETSDYLSIIRYIRYGVKNDPVFIKIGALDYYTLGHGSIMQHYNNSPTFDNRRIGLVADIDFGKFGFESIMGSFSPAGVLGLRGYIRPLQLTPAADIPIISNLELGASFVSDLNKDAGIINGNYNSSLKEFNVTEDKGSISILGFDIGLPLLNSSITEITLYADYSKISGFGSGVATGVKFDFNLSSLVNLNAKLERRFNNGKYIPAYFNSLYEIERFKVDSSAGTFTSKALALNSISENQNGFYGDLLIRVLGLFDIYGGYQRLDKEPKSGIMNLRAAIEPEGVPFVLRAGYDKINIQNEKDLFTLDDRSYLFTEFGYKPVEFLLISIVYSWTYTPVRGKDDKIIGFEPQKRIEPRISFVYPFKF